MSLRRNEDGMTLIEVVVAALCLALVLAASATLFATGDTSSLASQRQAEEVNVADQVIEQLRDALKSNPGGFAGLAMSAAPAAGTNTLLTGSTTAHTDPDDFVSAGSGCGTANEGYLIEANYDNTAEGLAPGIASWSGCPSGSEPLVIAAGGIVTPQQTVSVGSATATVYTYVTDTNVGCTTAVLGACNGANSGTPIGDARRVTVAVVLGNGATHNTGTGADYALGPNTPVFLSTIFTDPVPSNQPNSGIGLNLGATLG